ncbi:sin3 histone deacetylase corepressor complex component SDS3 [Tetranychus urticae]|uniref:Sin3 histone deacetylase corepressor complex component SDS3 n=1 Tax=Tetranychus urticae TaxID=32264 RepID=T1KQT8_TETUR|nr:sin3 histone deacetylase corepressor complex component SDS3 [Tetranychus urticae]
MSEFDFDDDESNDRQDGGDHDSDEDTEDASETEVVADMERYDGDYLEIKEQSDILNRMYQDKLSSLKEQLRQLDDGVHPDYVKRLKKYEQEYQDRLILNEAYLAYETERIEKEFIHEKKAALREFEERKVELKESLIADLEEKKKIAESERLTLELNSDSIETKATTTRKLRRRPNDPAPVPEKRKRGSPAQLNYLLDERDINDDLKALTRASSVKYVNDNPSDSDSSTHTVDVRVEDGKLFFERKWFHRGQFVCVKTQENVETNGTLASIAFSEIWIKKADNTKFRISLSSLQRGRYSIHKRAT